MGEVILAVAADACPQRDVTRTAEIATESNRTSEIAITRSTPTGFNIQIDQKNVFERNSRETIRSNYAIVHKSFSNKSAKLM